MTKVATTTNWTIIRMRLGMPLRSKEMMKFDKAVTTVTEAPITKAGFSWAVTARQEQMPNTNTVTGLVLRRGSMMSLKLLMCREIEKCNKTI